MKLHTNALLLAKDEFGFDEGVFTGYDEDKHKYDTASWGYDLDAASKKPQKAASLDDPRCVFTKLKQHFARYTLEVGERDLGRPGGADQAHRRDVREATARARSCTRSG